MKKNNIITGALLLSSSIIIVRLLGFIFRIYLSNKLGAEGMGVYSLIMSVYSLCITIGTSGLGLAVSTLVAQHISLGNFANAKKSFNRACFYALILSTVMGTVLFLFSDYIGVTLLKDARTVISLKYLAAGIPFISVTSCLRGYFIAARKTINPATGQIFEQLIKMLFIMLLLGYALPYGIEYSCAVVTLGITIGEIFCFIYSYIGYKRDIKTIKITKKADAKNITRSILKIIVPISLTSYIRSLLRFAEDITIVEGFKKFEPAAGTAMESFGMLRGMAMPLLIFPLSMLGAFISTLSPEITRLSAVKNYKKLDTAISKVIGYTFLMGILIVAVFMSYSRELGMVVYKNAQVGDMLKKLSFLLPFMCLETISVGILQGMNQHIQSMVYSVTDSVLRVLIVYFCIPFLGVDGFIIMVIVSNVYTSVLNFHRLIKVSKIRIRLKTWLLYPIITAISCSQITKAISNRFISNKTGMIGHLLFGITSLSLSYLVLNIIMGSINKQDFKWIWDKFKSTPVADST